jgi:hypothetical protein
LHIIITVSFLNTYLSRNVQTDDEISDGVSVISDSEDHDHDHSDHNEESTEQPIDWNKEELKIGHKRKKLILEQKATESENFRLTPPTTPTVDTSNRLQIQTIDTSEIVKHYTTPSRPQVNFKKLLLMGGVLTMLLAAILISIYQLNNLNTEIERIKKSLQADELLIAALRTYQKSLQEEIEDENMIENVNQQKVSDFLKKLNLDLHFLLKKMNMLYLHKCSRIKLPMS